MGAGLSEKIVIWWGERLHVHSAIHFGWRSPLGDAEPQQRFRAWRRSDERIGDATRWRERGRMTYRPFGLLLGCNA